MQNADQASTLVLSGGLDSYVLAHRLAAEGRAFRAVYIDFGKPVSVKERTATKRLSLALRMPVDYVDLPGLTAMQRGYVPENLVSRDEADIKGSDPVGAEYISGFHIILAITSYFAQITRSPSIVLGVIKDQFDRYDDLGNVFSSFESCVNYLNPSAGKFAVEIPFESMSKADVIDVSRGMNISLEDSWSCLHAGDSHCGTCTQCSARKAAFQQADLADPTTYEA